MQHPNEHVAFFLGLRSELPLAWIAALPEFASALERASVVAEVDLLPSTEVWQSVVEASRRRGQDLARLRELLPVSSLRTPAPAARNTPSNPKGTRLEGGACPWHEVMKLSGEHAYCTRGMHRWTEEKLWVSPFAEIADESQGKTLPSVKISEWHVEDGSAVWIWLKDAERGWKEPLRQVQWNAEDKSAFRQPPIGRPEVRKCRRQSVAHGQPGPPRRSGTEGAVPMRPDMSRPLNAIKPLPGFISWGPALGQVYSGRSQAQRDRYDRELAEGLNPKRGVSRAGISKHKHSEAALVAKCAASEIWVSACPCMTP